MMRSRVLVISLAAALLATTAGCKAESAVGDTPANKGSQGSAADGIHETDSGYNVTIDPADFVATVDNPYFPLPPGATWRYEGVTAEGKEVDTVTVTSDTKEILGVTATVVRDIVTVHGKAVEKTFDWYAQDRDGNVWYMGEDTGEYKNGKKLNSEGSWEAGVDEAQPGIFMTAPPTVSDAYRQEFYAGEAEDMFWVVEVGLTHDVPAGHFNHVVHTLEWSPAEPHVVGEKYFAPGVGQIGEANLAGGKELFGLVSYSGV